MKEYFEIEHYRKKKTAKNYISNLIRSLMVIIVVIMTMIIISKIPPSQNQVLDKVNNILKTGFNWFSIGILSIMIISIIHSIYRLKHPKNENDMSDRDVERLNRIIEFESGELLPTYMFIDYVKSSKEKLIINIDEQLKPVNEYKNVIYETPIANSEKTHNKKVKIANKSYKKYNDKTMLKYIDKHLDLFVNVKNIKEEQYQNELIRNAIATKDYKKVSSLSEQLKTLNDDINKQKISEQEEMEKLKHIEKNIVEQARM